MFLRQYQLSSESFFAVSTYTINGNPLSEGDRSVPSDHIVLLSLVYWETFREAILKKTTQRAFPRHLFTYRYHFTRGTLTPELNTTAAFYLLWNSALGRRVWSSDNGDEKHASDHNSETLKWEVTVKKH